MNYEDMSVRDLPLVSHATIRGPARISGEEYWRMQIPLEQMQNRMKIFCLQSAMEELPKDIVNHAMEQLVPVHRFMNGVYMRELTMPPGFVIVGRLHAQEHFCIMTEGRCTVFTEHGQEEMTAPYTFFSPAGEKRALFIHEQTTWITVHRTDQTDPKACQDELTIPEPSEMLARLDQQGEIK